LRCDVVGMHSEPQAILTAFSHMFRRAADSERTTCFIDIGAATTKVVVAHGKTMVLAKSIHVAGDALASLNEQLADQNPAASPLAAAPPRRAVATALSGEGGHQAADAASADVAGSDDCGPLAMIQARMRAEGGAATLTSEPRTHASTTPPSATPPVASAVPAATPAAALAENETLQCLVEELQLSMRHHQRLFPRRPIEKLVFLGGSSMHTAVCQHLARTLRIGAQLGDPLARLTRSAAAAAAGADFGVDLRKAQPSFAVPVGLCLSEPNV
jgi:Tfp pilus assembly PilM family ATPase